MIDKLFELKNACAITEDQLLADQLHYLDEGAIYIKEDTYLWYYVLGQFFRPKTIVEIGTRFGYSLKCLVKGSEQTTKAWIFDSEVDFAGSIKYVEDYFSKNFPHVEICSRKVNTRDINCLGLEEKVDLVHVDADHSTKGCYEDCILAHNVVKEGGIILVDDVGEQNGDPRAKIGADMFCKEFEYTPTFLNNFRGMYILQS